MKVDFTQTLKTLDGEVIENEGKNLTLKRVAIEALLSSMEAENESGEKKHERFVLAQKIHEGKEDAEFKAEEITLIKKLVGKLYLPLIVGQAYQLLDK